MSGDWQIITLERLFEGFFGKGLNYAIYKIADEKERLRFLVEQTERITGLKNLYGQNLQFHFSKKDVEQLLEQADIYPDAIHERVRRILFEQMRRYPYLFPRAMS